MKKTLLLLLVTLMALSATAQTMTIHMKDSSVVLYPTRNISKVALENAVTDGTIDIIGKGGDTITCQKEDMYPVQFTQAEASGLFGNMKFVDLGLSVKWATCNVGATQPEDFGSYFAWGETAPKASYTKDNYKYYHKAYTYKDADGFEYYMPESYETFDTIDSTDKDVACVSYGDWCRMPTQDEFQELQDSCTWLWIKKNGVQGYKVTATNGNWIFLPSAGNIDDSQAYTDYGAYWTANQNNDEYAHILYFNSDTYTSDEYRAQKRSGVPVRPVYEEHTENWDNIGTGEFMDIFWDSEVWYDVKIQRSALNHNRYRVVDPYKKMFGWQGDDFVFTIYNMGDDIDGWTVPFDGFVLYEPCNSGYYYTAYSQYVYAYHPYYFKSLRNEEDAIATNRVEAYNEDGTPNYIICSSYYYMDGVGGWNYSTYDAIKIRMPGYIPFDYSAEVEHKETINTENPPIAVASITLGADVSYARIGIVQGTATRDGLNTVATEGTVITGSGEYRISMPSDAPTAKYTIYVVTFNADGEQEDYNYTTYSYNGGSNTWTPRYSGTWTYSLYAFCNEDGTPYDDENLVLSQCDQDDSFWKISNVWYGVDFYFTWDQTTNIVSFEDQLTGANYGYGDIYAIDLTSYDNFDASYYDPDSKAIKFDIYYVDDSYSWGYGWETFKITDTYK